MAPCPAIVDTPWHLSIGVFIGVLGFLGVVVPLFRGKMGRLEKAAWMAFLAILLILEIRSIHLDQVQHDREKALASCEELRSFQEIASTLKSSIAASQTQFDTTIGHVDSVLKTTQNVASLSQKNLNNITGGDSYAYVVPQDSGPVIPLSLHNYGKNILSGVSITIINLQDPNWPFEIRQPIAIGTIAPYGFASVPVPVVPQPDPKTGIASYWIFIDAQNGSVDEGLRFRKSRKFANAYAYSLNVVRRTFFDSTGKPIFTSKQVTQLANSDWSDEQTSKP